MYVCIMHTSSYLSSYVNIQFPDPFWSIAERSPHKLISLSVAVASSMAEGMTRTSLKFLRMTLLSVAPMLFLVTLFLATCAPTASAFPFAAPAQAGCRPIAVGGAIQVAHVRAYSRRSIDLSMANNFFDDVFEFFQGMGGGGDQDPDSGSSDPSAVEGSIGSTRILTIPFRSVKVGGLRLYLSLYLMGMQNTPTKGAWAAHQSGDAGIDVYYGDQTGALCIELDEDVSAITLDRMGSGPSNAYVMHESGLIEGLLDELETIAGDPEIAVEDRLLVLEEPGTAITEAREGLAFL